jgi:O-antigen ligase
MAMNGSSLNLDRSWIDFKHSIPVLHRRSAEIPRVSMPTWISFAAYLITLALTQTSYGIPFMNFRWVTLGALTASAIADWILIGARGGHIPRGSNGQILTTYLLATFGTVIYAENWLFSGMRWGSHAAMLSIFVLFLPQLMIPRQTRRVLAAIKYIIASLLIFSWLLPLIERIPSSGILYKGAMGNANTMGHVAFIAALLFLQSALISKSRRRRLLSSAMTLAAVATVWQSGARSSTIALSAGVMLLLHYYRRETQRYAMLAVLLGGIMMVAFPEFPKEIARFFVKSESRIESTSSNPLRSRIPVWAEAYGGFRQRPLLGWGFGAASNVSKQHKFTLTAIGVVERDAVNDIMFMLEGCGLIGLGAYFLLIYIVFKQAPTKSQKSVLQSIASGYRLKPSDLSLNHTHVIFYVLSICLILLNQFDNSALSAGNFISVTLWASVGCAITLRHEQA